MIIHKTVLVSCHIAHSPQAIPLATSLLKSYVSDLSDLEVVLVDFSLEDSVESAVEKILGFHSHSVGFSMYIWNRLFIEEIIRTIRKMKPEMTIFAGGAEVKASSMSLSQNTHINYLIPGEGEIPFRLLILSLLRGDDSSGEKILPKKHETDLENIPSPYLSGILDPRQYDGLLWELSRGCPFNCSFCCESRGISGVRYFSEKRIVEELKLFEENQVEQIWVLDPTFNIDKQRAIRILSLIELHSPAIHYTFEIRAELLDRDLAEAFASLNCSLQIGLQSSDDKVLRKLNRQINKEVFTQKISLLNQCGAIFGLDLIYGLPGDNMNGFLSSLDFAIDQIPNHLDIFRLSVFPGTELYEKAEELGIVYEKQAPYHVISTDSYSAKELRDSEEIATAVDLFYNQGRSAGWLLSIIDYLNLKASEFFMQFSAFLKRDTESSGDIFALQNQFLIEHFSQAGHDDALAVAIDLLLFHHLYSEALHGVPEEQITQNSKPINPNRIYVKSALLKQGIFSYDVTVYYEMGMVEIKSFISEFSREVSYGLIFNRDFEILTMSVEKNFYQFISALDGKRTLKDILELIGAELEDMEDFIDYLLESKLLIPAV